MKKAILMSIQPKWLVKILNGDKTIEIRKTMPKCELPIDVYLYCTKGIKDILYKYKDKYYTQHYLTFTDSVEVLNSKVVAKFTLNKCYELEFEGEDWNTYYCKNTIISGAELERKSCLTQCDMEEYAGDKNIYAWHIDNLEILDKPKELSEFKVYDNTYDNVGAFGWTFDEDEKYYSIKKPPQSWQYVWRK